MSSAKKIAWYKIADHPSELHFPDNNILVLIVHNKKICVARIGEELFAFAWTCPHASGHLSDGFIDAQGQVVCPLHRYRFDPRTGRNTSGEGYYLKHWPVEQREDGVYVGMESKGSFWDIFG